MTRRVEELFRTRILASRIVRQLRRSSERFSTRKKEVMTWRHTPSAGQRTKFGGCTCMLELTSEVPPPSLALGTLNSMMNTCSHSIHRRCHRQATIGTGDFEENKGRCRQHRTGAFELFRPVAVYPFSTRLRIRVLRNGAGGGKKG